MHNVSYSTLAYSSALTTTQVFDAQKHQECLSRGSYTLSQAGDQLRTIQAESKGHGFGTAVFREWLKICIEKNYKPEEITVDAIPTSKGDPFYFYVLMGMIPMGAQDRQSNESMPYITREFIPEMLQVQRKILAAYGTPDQYSQKSRLVGGRTMCFSEAGLARWKETIEKKIPFKLFKFEHMPLNDVQQEEINDIVRTMKEIKAGIFTTPRIDAPMHEWSLERYRYGAPLPKLNVKCAPKHSNNG